MLQHINIYIYTVPGCATGRILQRYTLLAFLEDDAKEPKDLLESAWHPVKLLKFQAKTKAMNSGKCLKELIRTDQIILLSTDT